MRTWIATSRRISRHVDRVLSLVLAVSAMTVTLGSPVVIAAAGTSAPVAEGRADAPVAIAAPPCTPSGDLDPICGLQAPEDLVRLPGGGRLLVVQMRGPTHLPDSNLAELDLDTRELRVLPVRIAGRAEGTDASCTAPDPRPDLHGIDLARQADGTLELLVINHGSRQSIEFYHVVGDPAERVLEWRGCIVTPDDVRLNDVAVRPGGGLVATIMGEAKWFNAPDGFKFLTSGADTGYLLAWSPIRGFERLPGSEAAFPNGIAIDPGGRYAYFAAWTGRKLIKYDLEAARVVGTASLDFMPDNLSWGAGDSLLAAGIYDMAAVEHCLDGRTAFCTSPFKVVRIDTADLSVHTLIDGPNGVLGGASVAVQDGAWVYVGAWAGDRIVRRRMPAR
jgi:sugar lactone lactonase YvrE